MAANTSDIKQGMGVFGANGEKIGTVAEVWPAGAPAPGVAAGQAPTDTGALGDESRVGSSPSIGGGTGALGTESSTGNLGTGGGGRESLGSESAFAGSDTGALGTETSAASGPGAETESLGSETDLAGIGGGTESLGNESAATGVGEVAAGQATGAGPVEVVVEEVDVVAMGGVPPEDVGLMTGAPGQAGYSGGVIPTGAGYFKVDQGGIFGLGAKELYVPFDAVIDVVPGEKVVLKLTKADADREFSKKPSFL